MIIDYTKIFAAATTANQLLSLVPSETPEVEPTNANSFFEAFVQRMDDLNFDDSTKLTYLAALAEQATKAHAATAAILVPKAANILAKESKSEDAKTAWLSMSMDYSY